MNTVRAQPRVPEPGPTPAGRSGCGSKQLDKEVAGESPEAAAAVASPTEAEDAAAELKPRKAKRGKAVAQGE